MIKSFRHKSLRRFFDTGDTRGINAEHAERIRAVLTTIDEAAAVDGINVSGFRLHALVGDLNGLWAVTVRANWRIVFRFEDKNAYDVDLIDYH